MQPTVKRVEMQRNAGCLPLGYIMLIYSNWLQFMSCWFALQFMSNSHFKTTAGFFQTRMVTNFDSKHIVAQMVL